MIPYRDIDRDSGVEAYDVGADYIIVQFKEGKTKFYKYTNSSAGAASIQRMKDLAANGEGLNSFIMKNVKSGYESKW